MDLIEKARLNYNNSDGLFVGGGKRDRTADLLNAIQALSQLSYTPMFIKFLTTESILT